MPRQPVHPDVNRPVARLWARLMLGFFVAVFFASCSEMTADPEVDEQQIQQALEVYLPRLAEAYEQNEPEVLQGVAAEKEIATLERHLQTFADIGRKMEPTLKRFTVEDVQIWNHSNAFVTTLEIWDVRMLSRGSDTVLSQDLDQRSRVKYQMKRMDDTWLVLYRQRSDP